MASQELKQRVRDDPNPNASDRVTATATATAMNDKRKIDDKSRKDKRITMAKRGLRSLIIAVSIPLSLSLFSAYLGFNNTRAHDPVTWRKPFWFPPMWALHLTCPASSFLMGLSAWMVWAEGGFHRYPMALLLYLTVLFLTLIWDPIVFRAGATRLGLMVCLGMFGGLVGSLRMFGQVNPIAADLLKPCLAWVAFLSVVNLRLVFV